MRQRKTKQISFWIEQFVLHRGKVQAQRLGLQWGGYVLRALKAKKELTDSDLELHTDRGIQSRRVICKIPFLLWQAIREIKKQYQVNTMHLIGEIVVNQIIKDEKDGEQ